MCVCIPFICHRAPLNLRSVFHERAFLQKAEGSRTWELLKNWSSLGQSSLCGALPFSGSGSVASVTKTKLPQRRIPGIPCIRDTLVELLEVRLEHRRRRTRTFKVVMQVVGFRCLVVAVSWLLCSRLSSEAPVLSCACRIMASKR